MSKPGPESIDSIRELYQLCKQRPRVGLNRIDEIRGFLRHPDSEVRTLAMECLTVLSFEYPFRLRKLVPDVLTRLDDESWRVRTTALSVVLNMAAWYPEDFSSGTNLMVRSLNSTQTLERGNAAAAISYLAVGRPDIITPRIDALDGLYSVEYDGTLDEINEQYSNGLIEQAVLDDAKIALRGGDMGSREIERDLAGLGRAEIFSKPAIIGLKSVFAGVMFSIYIFVLIVNTFRALYRLQRYPLLLQGPMFYYNLFKKLKFFSNKDRAALYIRASIWPTFVQVFPYLLARQPISENPSAQTDELPDDWGEIASLVRERDEYECRNCSKGGGPKGDAELHVDHFIPRSRDGPDHPFNLRTLCKSCHEARHARRFD